MIEPHPLPDSLLAVLQDMPLEELAFEPVPVRPRRDGWSVAHQRGFILRLALAGSVTKAAKGVGKTRKSAYRLREHEGAESFASAWDKAHGWGADRMVDFAIERSIHGERRPYYYKGELRGEHIRFPSGLAMAVLNALDRRMDKRPKGAPDPETAFRLAVAELLEEARPASTENKGFLRPE